MHVVYIYVLFSRDAVHILNIAGLEIAKAIFLGKKTEGVSTLYMCTYIYMYLIISDPNEQFGRFLRKSNLRKGLDTGTPTELPSSVGIKTSFEELEVQ